MMKDSSRIIDNVFLLEEWKPATKIRSTLLFSTTFLFSFEWLIFLSPLLIFTFPKGPILEMKNHTVKKLVKIEKVSREKEDHTRSQIFRRQQQYGTGAVCASTVFVDHCSNEYIKLRFCFMKTFI